MKPPAEEVRISTLGREVLTRLKRRTGLDHWNEICRLAYCRALTEEVISQHHTRGDTAIRMEWKTFAGQYSDIFSCLSVLRAQHDGINVSDREERAQHFHSMLEYGIQAIRNTANLEELAMVAQRIKS